MKRQIRQWEDSQRWQTVKDGSKIVRKAPFPSSFSLNVIEKWERCVCTYRRKLMYKEKNGQRAKIKKEKVKQYFKKGQMVVSICLVRKINLFLCLQWRLSYPENLFEGILFYKSHCKEEGSSYTNFCSAILLQKNNCRVFLYDKHTVVWFYFFYCQTKVFSWFDSKKKTKPKQQYAYHMNSWWHSSREGQKQERRILPKY